MKTVVCTRYGSPETLAWADRPDPSPRPGEILVRVRASTVSSADVRVRALHVPRGLRLLARLVLGLRGPRRAVLGTELSGEVVAVGRGVRVFRPGDAVFAFTGSGWGCHAQYRCLPAHGAVALKPSGFSHEQAAALSFGGTTMLDFFRRADLRAGERVLVLGASGAVGTAAVQLARHAGARVTAVCSTANAALMVALGAERVFGRTAADFTCTGDVYDIIVDTQGRFPDRQVVAALAPGGRLIRLQADLLQMLCAPWSGWLTGHRVIAGSAAERPEYIHRLRELALSGAFVPVIDSIYPFEQVQAAHARVDTGRKRGSVVVRMDCPAGGR